MLAVVELRRPFLGTFPPPPSLLVAEDGGVCFHVHVSSSSVIPTAVVLDRISPAATEGLSLPVSPQSSHPTRLVTRIIICRQRLDGPGAFSVRPKPGLNYLSPSLSFNPGNRREEKARQDHKHNILVECDDICSSNRTMLTDLLHNNSRNIAAVLASDAEQGCECYL